MARPRTPRSPSGAFTRMPAIDPGDPDDDGLQLPEDDPIEIEPPRATPNPRLTRPPPPLSEPGDLREMTDLERVEPSDLRVRQDRARHEAAIRSNPFIGQFNESSFPRVPEDDPEWSYLWVRHMLPAHESQRASTDASNLGAKISGGLRYEVVRVNDLPDEWRQRMVSYRGKVEGIDGNGALVYRDLVLMRTSRYLRDQKQAANDYHARLQRRQVHQKLASDAQGKGYLARKMVDREDDRLLSPDDLDQI